MNKKVNILVSAILFLVLVACGTTQGTVSHSEYENNYQINSFWRQFNKSEFIQTIDSKKLNVEEYVKEIKQRNLSNDNIVTLYTDVQNSYNNVLNAMENDISDIDNILDFSTLNATNRYQTQLQLAEKKETIFINSAMQLINPDAETSFFGDIFNGLLNFIPGLNTAQSIYLNYLKQDMKNKLNTAKWKSWEVI